MTEAINEALAKHGKPPVAQALHSAHVLRQRGGREGRGRGAESCRRVAYRIAEHSLRLASAHEARSKRGRPCGPPPEPCAGLCLRPPIPARCAVRRPRAVSLAWVRRLRLGPQGDATMGGP